MLCFLKWSYYNRCVIASFQTACGETGNRDNVGEGGSTSVSQNEHDEIIATEKVLNAMLFYRRYGITRIHMSISSFQLVFQLC